MLQPGEDRKGVSPRRPCQENQFREQHSWFRAPGLREPEWTSQGSVIAPENPWSVDFLESTIDAHSHEGIHVQKESSGIRARVSLMR
jgi:hypothetical protein